MQRPDTIESRRRLYTEALQIIETEYGSNLALDDVARRIATSRRQLQRAFAEAGETTFRRHLTTVRMRRASELLVETSLPVRTIAMRVGYRQPAQFAKSFRLHYGAPPSVYRLRDQRPTRRRAA